MGTFVLPDNVASRLIIGDCWEWTGALNEKGYGRVRVGDREYRVHRFVYEALVGPIPEGKTLDHHCFNPRCANPDHMEVLSQRDNARRARFGPASRHRDASCARGHEYTDGNTMHRPNGTRQCRRCFNDARKTRYAERRAA